MSNITLPKEFSWVDLTNQQFETALSMGLNSSRDLFFQGRAGSGKSLLIKILSSMLKNVVVLSTTGITAVELCSEKIAAKTIHSFLSIPPYPIIRHDDLLNMSYKNKKVLNRAEVIIIDEVSMMSNHLFDSICKKIEMHRDDGSIPRFILFGDVLQLPPVINGDKIVNDFYQAEYGGKMMFFNSKFYKSLNFKVVHLRKSYRQPDMEFADKLFEIGSRDHTAETLEYFNQRVISLQEFEQEHGQYVYMTPTNKIVDQINNRYMLSLTGKSETYKASMSKGYPIDKTLNAQEVMIREGAQVMCLMNSYDERDDHKYSNGMIGEVIDLNKDEVTIKIANGQTRHIGKTTTYLYEIELDHTGTIRYIPKHWYKQIDCKICRAATIHKVQGKQFDAGYVSLQNWVPQGITYVGLSRLKTLEGLGLSRPLQESDIKVNEESYEFLYG